MIDRLRGTLLVLSLQINPLIVCLLIALACNSVSGQAIQDTMKTDKIKKGDRCIVCNISYDHLLVVIIYKGRRVPLCPKHPQTFLDDPGTYFGKLQPRGALFQEEAILEQPMKKGWLWFGIWIFVATVTAGLSANIAMRKGFSSLKWFMVGLATNFVGLVFVMSKPSKEKITLPDRLAKVPSTSRPLPCPDCRTENHPTATKCTGCGRTLSPKEEAEVKRAGLS